MGNGSIYYGFNLVLLSAVGTGGLRGDVWEVDLNPYAATRQNGAAIL